jgi:hypothetical protein
MEKLIEVLQKVFLFFLYPSPEERSRHLELRKLYQELRYLKLTYTDMSGKRIHPGFADQVLRLYKLVKAMDKVLKLPHRRDELLKMEDLSEYLVLQQLDENIRSLIEGLTADKLFERINSSMDQENTLRQSEEEWREINHRITELHHTSFNQDLFQLEILYALMDYDFELLLAKFDPTFHHHGKDEQPRFRECPADWVEQELLDLYFVIGGIRIQQDVRSLVKRVYSFFHADKEEAQGTAPPELNKILDGIELVFENDLSENTFGAMLKLMNQDPGYAPERMKPEHDYIDDVWHRLHRRYQNSLITVNRSLLDRTSQQNIARFFPEGSLQEISFYSRESDGLFSSEQLYGYLYPFPLRILKTYNKHILENGLLTTLMKINFDAIFTDADLKNDFQASIEQTNEISDYLREFESSISRKNTASVTQVIGKGNAAEGQAVKAEELEQFRDEADRGALYILRYARQALENLNLCIRELLEEHHQLHPHRVTNIKVIGGGQNREMLKDIEQAYHVHAGVMNILDSYIDNRLFPGD